MGWLDDFIKNLAIKAAGNLLPPQPAVNFTGPGVTVSNDPATESTTVNIPGSAPTGQVSAKAAATSNITKSGTQTIDGVGCGVGDVVLLTGQTAATENGLWIVASGAWARTTDPIASGMFVFAQLGTANKGTWALVTPAPITVDATALSFIRVERQANIALYGASPAAADNRAAIQLAIDAVSAIGGGEVLIPYGAFTVGSFIDAGSHTILRPRDGVSVVGLGYGSCIKIATALSSSGDWNLFKAFDASGSLSRARFTNFRVDCSGNPNVAAGALGFGQALAVFHIRRGSDVVLENVWIEHNMGSNPVIFGADASGSAALFTRGKILRCFFNDCGNDTGGYLQDHATIYSVASDVTVDGNSFQSGNAAAALATFTVNTGTDFITSTAHGLSNGDKIRLFNAAGTLPAPFNGNVFQTSYVVINKTTDTFQLAMLATPGTPIDITTAGAGTHRWYRPSARFHSCAIELHCTASKATKNTIAGHLTGFNIGADTIHVDSLDVYGNDISDSTVGFSIFHETSFRAGGIKIHHNPGVRLVNNGVYAEVGVATGLPGSLSSSEGLVGLSINNNDFSFASQGAAPVISPQGVFLRNNIKSGRISTNQFAGFTEAGIALQPSPTTPANSIVHNLAIKHNEFTDCVAPINIVTSDLDTLRAVRITSNMASMPGGGTYTYGIVVSTGGSDVVVRDNDMPDFATAPEYIAAAGGSHALTGIRRETVSASEVRQIGGAALVSGTLHSGGAVTVDTLTASSYLSADASKVLVSLAPGGAKLLATDGGGNQTTLPYSQAQSASSVPVRDVNGSLFAGAFVGTYYDAASAVQILVGASVSNDVRVGSTSGNMALIGGSGAINYGSGVGVVALHECNTVPTTNPTYPLLYTNSGIVYVRSANGHVTTIAEGSPQTYTTTNTTTSRSLDETGATLVQVAHVLGTLIRDLQAKGIFL
jgi:hypothetical protein